MKIVGRNGGRPQTSAHRRAWWVVVHARRHAFVALRFSLVSRFDPNQPLQPPPLQLLSHCFAPAQERLHPPPAHESVQLEPVWHVWLQPTPLQLNVQVAPV